MVRGIVLPRIDRNGRSKVLDVGCGTGNLHGFLADSVSEYEGVDVIRYDGFPSDCRFHQLDLDSGRAELPDAYADFVVAVETIEHLENPRAFMRELVRLCRPGGWVIVTTPNQLSLLSKLTLLVKNQFNAFTDTNYPAHITALLEIDLHRIAKEAGLDDVETAFTLKGRFPGTSGCWPRFLSRRLPRGLSDNLAIVGRCSEKQ
jgi:2-polyprenyl-3-methyl-5-hydroxy-6-metoxy-1,4-benzoquinol methylase